VKKIFKCDCGTHLVEIGYETRTKWTHTKTKKIKIFNLPELWIGIYDIYNPDTGRKYKKPKLVADVIFNEGKSIDFIMHFLEDIAMKYAMRKKQWDLNVKNVIRPANLMKNKIK